MDRSNFHSSIYAYIYIYIFLKLVDILNEDEYPRQICREKSVEIILFFLFFYIKKKKGKTDHMVRVFAKVETNGNFLSRYFQLEKRDY